MNPTSGLRALHQLARLYGLQTAYYDVHHRRQPASTESLLLMLRSLGAPVATLPDVPAAWRERRQTLWQQRLEPVVIAWENQPPLIPVRLPSVLAEARLSCHLTLETGEKQTWQRPAADLPAGEVAEIEGITYVLKYLPLPVTLPWGYHRLTVEIAGSRQETLIIAAPRRAYSPPAETAKRDWGVFLPLYALHRDKSWGGGDFSDLEALTTWVAGMGGRVVATLPLLATFLNDILESSPYLPASRRLWNEFYLDINNIPELGKCPAAQALLASASFQPEIEALRHSPYIDYHRQMALKRRVLAELCQCFFTEPSRHFDELQHFTNTNPVVEDYARFRATGEKQRTSWRFWPQPLRDGVLKTTDYDEANRLYHLYVQWLAHQQIASVAQKARREGLQLYLDLPLGVHPDGYDVWRERQAFLPETSVGAPPDVVFRKGQNWAFPPPHPERIREQGYRYTIAYLRHHLRLATILRIDHIMGFHRLFCIPQGMEAREGVYVRYHAEEFYAILSLESQRHQVVIVGEDLGTVPAYVRPAMKRHRLRRTYVLHYELSTSSEKAVPPPANDCVASLNTHDMFPFAAIWQGRDITGHQELGLLAPEEAEKEKAIRQKTLISLNALLRQMGWLKGDSGDVFSALQACLSLLASSQAQIVLVNLEDLWLETQPQNIPSTTTEYPNWRRKAQYRLEQFCQMPQIVATLQMVNRLRQQDRRER